MITGDLIWLKDKMRTSLKTKDFKGAFFSHQLFISVLNAYCLLAPFVGHNN